MHRNLKSIFSLFFSVTIASTAFSADSSDILSLIENGSYPALFALDPAARGASLIAIFQRLQYMPYSSKSTYEIALRTYINQKSGFIPFVNNMVAVTPPPPSPTASSYNTLLIIWYRNNPGGDISQNKYQVLPIEHISQMIYSTNTITNKVENTFHITNPQQLVPYFDVDPAQRAFDIRAAVYTLNYLPPYAKSGPWPNVSLTTTLRGIYNGVNLDHGIIPFVREVSVTGNMMIVTYQLSQSNNLLQYIVLAPEQVISINYLRN